jgi:phosphatidylglycerol:prolipoprotein diacylglycerol transferase
MPNREAFRIGPFDIFGFTIDIPVYWYGIMIMLGVIVASYLAFRDARRRGEDPDHVWQMFPWVLISGIVGARVGFILSQIGDPAYQDIGRWIDIRQGGLSIQGTVVGGLIALILYCRRYKLSFFKWTDIIVPGLAIAQGIGRIGNYFNQEAFGSQCDLPWCIPISPDRQREVAGIQNPDPNARFHPTFAYEMIWNFALAGLLFWLGRQKRIRLREGDLLWIYLIVYSIGRFIIEQIRVDSATVAGLKTPAVIALITIVIGWTAIIMRHRPGSPAPYSEVNLPEGERRRYAARAGRPIPANTYAVETGTARRQASRVRRVQAPLDSAPARPGGPLRTEGPQGSDQ